MKYLICLFVIFNFLYSSNLRAFDNLENKKLICDFGIEKLLVWGFDFIDYKKVKMIQIYEVKTFEDFLGYEARAKIIYIGDNFSDPASGHFFQIDRKTLILTDVNLTKNLRFNVILLKKIWKKK